MADPLQTSQTILNARQRADSDERAVQPIDPIHNLRSNVFNFFTDRLDRIKKKENLLEKIQEALESQVDGGELTFDQLRSLFSSVSREQSAASEGIISLFRPVPGTPSIFANNIGAPERPDPYKEAFNSLSPEKLQKIDALFRFLESAGANASSMKNAGDSSVAVEVETVPHTEGD